VEDLEYILQVQVGIEGNASAQIFTVKYCYEPFRLNHPGRGMESAPKTARDKAQVYELLFHKPTSTSTPTSTLTSTPTLSSTSTPTSTPTSPNLTSIQICVSLSYNFPTQAIKELENEAQEGMRKYLEEAAQGVGVGEELSAQDSPAGGKLRRKQAANAGPRRKRTGSEGEEKEKASTAPEPSSPPEIVADAVEVTADDRSACAEEEEDGEEGKEKANIEIGQGQEGEDQAIGQGQEGEDQATATASPSSAEDKIMQEMIAKLQQQLAEKDEKLSSTQQELSVALCDNVDLQTELESTRQSLNEELEAPATSNEEMLSALEELSNALENKGAQLRKVEVI